MVTRRQERVSERIHQEASNLLQSELSDPRLAHVTVTDVEVGPDLKLATVFVSALGDQEARDSAVAALEHATGYIRRELAQRLGLRVMPELRFMLDESWERGARLDSLLDKLAGIPAHVDEVGTPAEHDEQGMAGEPNAGPDEPAH